MIPKRIAMKNFLSFGELPGGKPVEFTFPDGDDRLWVLCGPNGTGKSAVFDAIAYALFGEHRGGKQKGEQLIRHNTNGFEVEVDFEFNGTDYRIRRTRTQQGTTQQVSRKADGEWQPIRAGSRNRGDSGPDINEWAVRTLGLSFEAFTNSVLLQQGKADKLFAAGREERLDVLKGIIGFEQYETLSGRVNVAARDAAKRAEQLLDQLNAIEPVADEAIDEATRVEQTAADIAAEAQEEVRRASERVTKATVWEKLEGERRTLEGKLADADRLRADGKAIRAKKKRLDELTAVVPVLESLIGLRAILSRLEKESAAARVEVEAKTTARDAAKTAAEAARAKAQQHQAEADKLAAAAKELVEEIRRWTNYLKEAEEIAGLDRRLIEEFPPDLDSQLTGAKGTESKAAESAQESAAARTRADTLLSHARDQQKRFGNVKTGVECPHCRQPVSEAHGKKVRADLAAEVKRLQGEFDTAAADAATAATELATARKQLTALQQQTSDRAKLRIEREARSNSLEMHGAPGDAEDLRGQLAKKENQKTEDDRTQKEQAALAADATLEAKKQETVRKKLEGEVEAADQTVRAREGELATARGQEQAKFAQLTFEWKAKLQTLYQEQLAELAGERDHLTSERVTELYSTLERDEALRVEWERRRAEVHVEIGKIPESDRIPEAVARQRHAQAESTAAARHAHHTAAMTHLNELTGRKDRRKQLTDDHRKVAEDQRLLAKLDKLLGEGGLQRELVREAEEAVIAFANDTLRELSGGDLTLEEDTSLDSTRTFDLRARRAGGEPIGIAFLSGSQRFRVAVSIALAVGRFAGGRARPLESVIIDEGFGSLDPDGLEAMAKELKRLQEAKSLKRVILVSHQPEFTEQFPVGYTLTPGEAGTTASAFRR